MGKQMGDIRKLGVLRAKAALQLDGAVDVGHVGSACRNQLLASALHNRLLVRAVLK